MLDAVEVVAIGFAILIIIAPVCVVILDAYPHWREILLFRHSTPDRAIAYYHRSSKARRIFSAGEENDTAEVAYRSAFAAVLYGQFDRARKEIAAISDWTNLSFLNRGRERRIHSLLSLYEAKDCALALRSAQEARDLCGVHADSHKVSMGIFEAHLAVCKLLTGDNDPQVLKLLTFAAKQHNRGVSPAISAWALATHYKKLGDGAAAAEYVGLVQRLVPHCSCLKLPSPQHISDLKG